MFRYFVLCFFVVTVRAAVVKDNGCYISTNNDLGEPQPLILNSFQTKILFPTIDDLVPLQDGEEFKVACIGNTVLLNNKTFGEVESVVCKNGRFSVRNKSYDFNQITCGNYSENIARYGGLCADKYMQIELGFKIPKKKFLKVFDVCFDDSYQTPLYSHYVLSPTIRGHQHYFPRPSWVEDEFFDYEVNILYTQKRQAAVINKALGLEEDSTKYIDPKNKNYLARGHLTAKADFVYGLQQQVTFHLINVAPQWEIFNEKNWLNVEMDVRRYAVDKNLNLDVYTGTYGVMTLPHSETGEETEIYLYVSDHGVGLPVPLLFWKAVYDKKSKSGVVIIGVNNPYIKDITEAIICEDITEDMSWGTWTKNDMQLGYIYVCALDEFAREVPYFPELDIQGVLT